MNVLDQLRGTDRRKIGASNIVAELATANDALFAELIHGLHHPDAAIRMRAADAAEKASTKNPELLQPHVASLVTDLPRFRQQEVRWHVAQMLGRCSLTEHQAERACGVFSDWLRKDSSKIVQVNSLQAIFDISGKHKQFANKIRQLVQWGLRFGSPALKARCRRLQFS